jgi:ribosomal protein S18 acetylase RimI-like enzyme
MAVMSSEGTRPVELRAASPADARGLAALHLSSWRATYEPLLDPAGRARLTLAERLAAWERRLADDPWGVWLAERDGHVVGFVSVEPAHEADLGPDRIAEVTSLHVAPELHGQGLGRRLLAHAEVRLRVGGYQAAVLWVLAGNRPARDFYERLGWRLDGMALRREMGGLAGLPVVDEVRYRRSL